MANNTALDFLNPSGLLNGQTILADGQTGLQSAADVLNHVYAESATVLLQWPARVNSEGIGIDATAASPGDTLLSTYVRQPEDRSSWVLRVRAAKTSGTFTVKLIGSVDGEIASVTIPDGANVATEQTATATVTTLAQGLTVKVFASSVVGATIYSVIVHLADESI